MPRSRARAAQLGFASEEWGEEESKRRAPIGSAEPPLLFASVSLVAALSPLLTTRGVNVKWLQQNKTIAHLIFLFSVEVSS